MPRVPGVRTARKLLVGFGAGLTVIALCSVAALISLTRLNAVARHLAIDPVPGSAAVARIAMDFNEYRVLEATRPIASAARDASLTGKAADIDRDLAEYLSTITQSDDRQRFADLVAMWASYRDPGSDSPPSTASSPRRAATSTSRASSAPARHSVCTCR